MILNFNGGVKLPLRREEMQKELFVYNDCSAVCFKIKPGAKVEYSAAYPSYVRRGEKLADVNGTPVYSSVSGTFRGKAEISKSDYLVVSSDGAQAEVCDFAPETRAITDISPQEMIELARKYGITDTRSGKKLWRMLDAVCGRCKRIIIDCTESDPESTVTSFICREYPRDTVFGAKMALHAAMAPKGVFAFANGKKDIISAINKHISDKELFASAEIAEKYPIDDRALINAIYLKELAYGEAPEESGYLVIGAETAKVFFDCVSKGVPQLDRYISVCGRGFGEEKNLKVPAGITLHDIVDICGGLKKGFVPVENSRLNGEKAFGALGGGVRAIISVKPAAKRVYECTFCFKCVDACPMKLLPLRALNGNADIEIYRNCTECGACEYICPSGIPLISLINSNQSEENQDEDYDENPEVAVL